MSQERSSESVLADVVAGVLARHNVDASVADDVVSALSEIPQFSNRRNDSLPLLSAAGRVLVEIMAQPDMTTREMSLRLGTAESNAQRAVANLVQAGIVSRSRLGRQNQYGVNMSTLLSHPDVLRLLWALDWRLGLENGDYGE